MKSTDIDYLSRVIDCIIRYKEDHKILKETLICVSTQFKCLYDLYLERRECFCELAGVSDLMLKDSNIRPRHFLAHIVKKIGSDDAGRIIVNCGPYDEDKEESLGE